MSFVITEKTIVDDWEPLLREYLIDYRKSPEESIAEIISNINTNLLEKKRIAFVAYLNNTPCGYIMGRGEGEICEVAGFFVQPISYENHCGFRLVQALVSKAFEQGFKHYRHGNTLPINHEPTFKEELKQAGFLLFSRVEMFLDLEPKDSEVITLPESYHFKSFSLDQVDAIVDLIVKANPVGHTDTHIYPEMMSVEVTKKVFGGFFNDFKALKPEINPQLYFKDKIVGMSLVHAFDNELSFVAEVSIHPDHQGKGLGKALMKQIIADCKKADYNQLGLAVTVENVGAYKLYEKLGFKKSKDFLTIVKHKEDLVK